MRTIKGDPISELNEQACILFCDGGLGAETTYYDTLEQAEIAFKALYGAYPEILHGSDRWYPEPNMRVNPNSGCKAMLYYRDARREGWCAPACDKNGKFYRGAFTRQTSVHTVPGYGYMHKNEKRDDSILPIGTARGDKHYPNADPVNI